jgi:hypothetical protein
VMKDLRVLIREGAETALALEAAARVGVSERLDDATAEGLARYAAGIETAIKESTEAVYERFDTIYDSLMGVTKTERRTGHSGLEELPSVFAAARKKGE